MKRNDKGVFVCENGSVDYSYKNKNWLEKYYLGEKQSIQDISKRCNVNQDTIRKQLRRFNIKIRPNSYRFFVSPKPYMSKDWLSNQYINEQQSMKMISNQMNVSIGTIQHWLKKLNIIVRDGSQCRTGNLNPRFKGGFINQGYRFIYNPEVAKLHNRKCQKGNYIQEHILVMSTHLGRPVLKSEIIHHKDGNRINNDIDNLQLFPSEKSHQQYEQIINTFCKRILFGDLAKSYIRKELLSIFNKFLNEQ